MSFHFEAEVDLHGLHVEEAMLKLEEALFTHQGGSVMIIHGKGDGILRSAVRDYLREHPCVDTVDFGEAINIPGGDGVTIARVL